MRNRAFGPALLLALLATPASAQLFSVDQRVKILVNVSLKSAPAGSDITRPCPTPTPGNCASQDSGWFGTVLQRAYASGAWWYEVDFDACNSRIGFCSDGWVPESALEDAGTTTVDDLPYNTWTKIAAVPNNFYVCDGANECARVQKRTSSGLRGYNSSTIGAGKLFTWGGGHAGHPGNDVWIFDPSARQWTQTTPVEAYPHCCVSPNCTSTSPCPNPTCVPGSDEEAVCAVLYGSSVNRLTPNDLPYAYHIFRQIAYHPGRGEFFLVTAGAVAQTTRLWGYRPDLDTWTLYNDGGGYWTGYIDRAVLFYDPPSESLFWYAGTYVQRFTFGANTWTTISTTAPSLPGSERYTAYDSWRNKHLVSFTDLGNPVGGKFRWYTVATNTWEDITNVPSALLGNINAFDFDSIAGQFLFLVAEGVGQTAGIWSWNSVDDWVHLSLSGEAPTAAIRFGHLHYDPSRELFFYLRHNGAYEGGTVDNSSPWGGYTKDVFTRVWAFRYLPSGVTPAPTNTRTPTATATPALTWTPSPSPTATGPTCAGTVRYVGPTRALTTMTAAANAVADNDCVYIDAGEYRGAAAVAAWERNNLVIRGVGHVVLNADGVIVPGKGLWLLKGTNTTIENIEFACATSRLNYATHCSGKWVGTSGDGAGIRLETGLAIGATIRDCVFRDNDDGILGGTSGTGDIVIERSAFFRNGGMWGALHHNVYVNGSTLTFQSNHSYDTDSGGHELKSRATTNLIAYNVFSSRMGSGSVLVELPYGGRSYLIGNVMEKGVDAQAGEAVKYDAESRCTGSGAWCRTTDDCGMGESCPGNPLKELYVINNTMVSYDDAAVAWVKAYSGTSPTVWLKNNLLVGDGTDFTCANGSGCVTTLTTNYQQLSPLFRYIYFQAPDDGDYRLLPGAPAIDAGTAPGSVNGVDLTPYWEYRADREPVARPVDATLDIGASEWTGFEESLPTLTPTPTHTPTTVPTRTPTSVTNLYCPGTDRETIYVVATSEDDGGVGRDGSTYPPTTTAYQWSDGYQNYSDSLRRSWYAPSLLYSVRLWLLRWHTATLSDGTAWPVGSRVTGAFMRPRWLTSAERTDARDLVAEWVSWTPPLTDAEWAVAVPAPTDPTYAGATAYTVPQTGGYQTIALAHSEQVNRTGYTGLRLAIADSTPPTGLNSLLVQNVDVGYPAQLVVCWQPTSVWLHRIE